MLPANPHAYEGLGLRYGQQPMLVYTRDQGRHSSLPLLNTSAGVHVMTVRGLRCGGAEPARLVEQDYQAQLG